MYHVYENHLSGYLYISDEQGFDELYCEQCGDSDRLIETFETQEEALRFIETEENL